MFLQLSDLGDELDGGSFSRPKRALSFSVQPSIVTRGDSLDDKDDESVSEFVAEDPLEDIMTESMKHRNSLPSGGGDAHTSTTSALASQRPQRVRPSPLSKAAGHRLAVAQSGAVASTFATEIESTLAPRTATSSTSSHHHHHPVVNTSSTSPTTGSIQTIADAQSDAFSVAQSRRLLRGVASPSRVDIVSSPSRATIHSVPGGSPSTPVALAPTTPSPVARPPRWTVLSSSPSQHNINAAAAASRSTPVHAASHSHRPAPAVAVRLTDDVIRSAYASAADTTISVMRGITK